MVLDIIDQFTVVAQQGDYEFRTFIMYVCLYALAAVGLFVIAWAVWSACKSYVEKVGRGSRLGQIVGAAFLVALVLYGGTKAEQTWRFNFQNGLHDLGSYCSNDVIHASWDYAPAYAGYAFRWCYRDLTITNEVGVCIDEFHYLPDANVTDMVAEAVVPGATNMEVTCYAQYVQPVHVVTNGTYHVGGIMRSLAQTNEDDYASADFVTPGITIQANLDDGGELTLTPTNEPPESVLGLLLNEINNNENQEE